DVSVLELVRILCGVDEFVATLDLAPDFLGRLRLRAEVVFCNHLIDDVFGVGVEPSGFATVMPTRCEDAHVAECRLAHTFPFPNPPAIPAWRDRCMPELLLDDVGERAQCLVGPPPNLPVYEGLDVVV